MKTIEFERRLGEKTVIQWTDSAGKDHEFDLTISELTATRAKLAISGDPIKRVLREEAAAEKGGK